MDSLRGFEDEAALASAHDDEPSIERPPEVGVDERRMHVRAYNYWVSLLNGRPYPSINDVDPHTIEDFGGYSVLLDFSVDQKDPEIAFLGRELRAESGVDQSIRNISQIPARSLLSRLTDHYMQIIANRAPIGFEAEFVGQRGANTMYRGILMPLSSDGESIDFIYGVINWKELADSSTAQALESEVDRAIAAAAPVGDCPVWADGPNAEIADAPALATDENLSLWPEDPDSPPSELAADAALADRLNAARHCAGQAASGEQRSRAALYRALGHAYDFALAAEAAPEDYAELLADAGLKAQARAPMTPIAKLVFGADYDKTRLTEFAAALSWAARERVPQGEFADLVAGFDGGLKGVVQAERRARRPAPAPDRAAEIRDRLRTSPAFAHVEIELPESDDEFVLLVARREPGGVAIVAPVTDSRLIAQAIRKSAA
ncbi:MAG: PAS domain-containing protein [Allosphingosinicella sp.]